MKNRNTLFNANHLALMHGLSINPTPARRTEADWQKDDERESARRHGRRPHWWLLLLHLFTKTA
ncbi:MAG: hypothetical protein HND44_04920 [Chloroflexi bacterium]|nr:hypothetical protein [Ardenticatenaceae bacterium]MBL1127837.1 hypothetical protein [Chloroflexota bacterium]NOG33906.1 hypothetical protein [Chloroflexota bacterium]GIK54762.1 MAG: hypothetical protein BroJett015_04250 [Chloroflexota bacterium]